MPLSVQEIDISLELMEKHLLPIFFVFFAHVNVQALFCGLKLLCFHLSVNAVFMQNYVG
jgi:hypothetical protein